MNFNQFKIPEGSLESRIRKNVTSRQKLKKKWDKHCKYGAEASAPDAMEGAAFAVENFKADDSENWVRLLDEGVVVEGDGTPYAVIAKGTIKEWFDNLPANFKGYINKDHISGIGLGNYSKADLKLVDIGDGRYGVDVNVKLDHELYAVKDLLRQMDRKALSSEFYYDADEYVKASVVTGDKNYPDWWLIPKISAVAIVGYAVVDNPKNANSYDPNLLEKASAGDEERNNDMNIEELRKLAAQGDAEAIEALKKLEAENGDEDAGDEGADEGAGESDADKTNAGAEGEGEKSEEGDKEGEGDGEKSDEDADGEGEGEGDKEDEGENFSTEDLVAKVTTLKADYEAVKAENEQLKAQLAAQKNEKADLATKLTEVLGLASASNKTEGEGAATSKKKEGDEDEYTASLRKSFSEL